MYAESQARSEAHSHAQVLDAVGRLTEQDFARLRAAACIWMRDLGLDTVAKDADDQAAGAEYGQGLWGYYPVAWEGAELAMETHKPAVQRVVIPRVAGLDGAGLRAMVEEVARQKGTHADEVLAVMMD